MKIAYITAGAAGMYCGSCIHDNTLAAALIKQGHDVTLIPTYTPIRTDENDVSISRVFYPAINVYLEQKTLLFRHTPWLVDRWLASPRLLNWASRFAASTNARDLGEMTLSVLRGEQGNQGKELERLVVWLRDEIRPEIVHLTNSMFLGFAEPIKRELGVPVLCSVQGEDIFLEDLPEPYKTDVHDAVRERARHVDRFVATSSYYADFMVDYLRIPADKMTTVRLGLDLGGHGEGAPLEAERPFVVGYLARVCPEKGLHLLVEAFRRLSGSAGRGQVRLRVAGWLGERDREYSDSIVAQLESWGLSGEVDFVGEVDHAGKIEFLRTLHVLSVPTVYREPKGLYVLEAMANGIPVVQPRHGAFPELIEATGGGLLVEPASAEALEQALRALMDDESRRGELARLGKEAVFRDFNAARMAADSMKLYESTLAGSSQPVE